MRNLFLLLMSFCCFCIHGNGQNYTSLNNEDFAKIIAHKKTQLIDVRTPAEFATGHLQNAINMDVNNPNFDTQIAILNSKNPVAIYCRSGKRSKTAAQKLAGKGFKVYELNTGILKWNGTIIKSTPPQK